MIHIYLIETLKKALNEYTQTNTTKLSLKDEILKLNNDFHILSQNLNLINTKECCDKIIEYIHNYEEIDFDIYFMNEITYDIIKNPLGIQIIDLFHENNLEKYIDHTQVYIHSTNNQLCEYLINKYKDKLDYDDIESLINDEDGISDDISYKLSLFMEN